MKKIAIVLLASFSLVGCIGSDLYSGDVYSVGEATRYQSLNYGTIIGLRNVTVQNNTGNVVGTATGATVGGLVGRTVGGGRGKDLATVAGVLLGGAAGQATSNQLNKSPGVQLDIKYDDGRMISVVQTIKDSHFSIGQRVRITGSGDRVTVSPLS